MSASASPHSSPFYDRHPPSLSGLLPEIKLMLLDACLEASSTGSPNLKLFLTLSRVSKEFYLLHNRINISDAVRSAVNNFLPAAVLIGNLDIFSDARNPDVDVENMKARERKQYCGLILQTKLSNPTNEMLGRAFIAHAQIKKLATVARRVHWHPNKQYMTFSQRRGIMVLKRRKKNSRSLLKEFMAGFYLREVWPKLDYYFYKKDLEAPVLSTLTPLIINKRTHYTCGKNASLAVYVVKTAQDNGWMGIHADFDFVFADTRAKLSKTGMSKKAQEAFLESLKRKVDACFDGDGERMELEMEYKLLCAIVRRDSRRRDDIIQCWARDVVRELTLESLEINGY